MKSYKSLLTLLLACLSASGQVVFTTNDLPSQPGETNISYYSIDNNNVSSILALSTNGLTFPGTTNVVQDWSFSGNQQLNETLWTVSIIPAIDGNDASQFSGASYAEQDSTNSEAFSWQYYGFTSSGTSPGRLYFGIDEPEPDVTAYAVFHPPTTDIPSTVSIGQTWSRSLYWLSLYFGSEIVSNYFSASARVDAGGILNLPGIGQVQALRVHETHVFSADLEFDGIVEPIELNTNQYYYWLVPKLGVAAQVTEYGDNVYYPGYLSITNSVLRMYYANYFTNSPPPPPATNMSNLSIKLTGTNVNLTWTVFTNAISYEVQYNPGLSATNWQTLVTVTTNSWNGPIPSTNRFYRVVGIQ